MKLSSFEDSSIPFPVKDLMDDHKNRHTYSDPFMQSFRAVCSLVVSPPISIVIPFILFAATGIPPLLKKVKLA